MSSSRPWSDSCTATDTAPAGWPASRAVSWLAAVEASSCRWVASARAAADWAWAAADLVGAAVDEPAGVDAAVLGAPLVVADDPSADVTWVAPCESLAR